MSLIKYKPAFPVSNVGSWVDEFFNRSIGDIVGADFLQNQPSVNIFETTDNFRMEIAAPGLEKENFQVSVDKGYLTVSASKEQKEEENTGKYRRREFNYTSFKRNFQLPDTIDSNAINAAYENGLLVVTLPKLPAAKAEATRVIQIA